MTDNESKVIAKQRIIVIDDSNFMLKALQGILGNDYDLHCFTSGKDIMRLIKEIKPALIMLDILMPDICGFELIKMIKADISMADIPVIFLTGLGDEQNEEKGLELGAADYISKPLRPSVVFARVKLQVDNYVSRRELLAKSQRKPKIMIVDDNVTNLNVARMALSDIYDVALISSGEKALSIVSKIMPDLIILDIEMPNMSGFETAKRLKAMTAPINSIPIIFVTARDDTGSELEGLTIGAVDYITKPFSFPLLQKRIELHLALVSQQKELYNYNKNLEQMVEDKTKALTNLQQSIVCVLSEMCERRDGSTGDHLMRTQKYLRELLFAARRMGIYPSELRNADADIFTNASQLHDIGKISIPDRILLNPNKLTDEEYEIMKTHTKLGEQAIMDVMAGVEEQGFLEVAAAFAGAHHERWDGRGYPRGLRKTEIPIAGRLMAIADVYDALVSERPYKQALTHEASVNIIVEGSGTHFDPKLVEAFLTVADLFKEISQPI